MHRSQPVFAVSGSPGELRTLSLPCYNDASTSQLQRQQDELDSDVMRVVATAARLRPPTSGRDLTEHASNGATGTLVHPLYTTLEYDGFRPASRGLITECVATAGLSGYSSYVGELANVTPPTFQLQQASSDVREYDRESVELRRQTRIVLHPVPLSRSPRPRRSSKRGVKCFSLLTVHQLASFRKTNRRRLKMTVDCTSLFNLSAPSCYVATAAMQTSKTNFCLVRAQQRH